MSASCFASHVSPLQAEFWDRIAERYESIFLPRHIKQCIPAIVNLANSEKYFEKLAQVTTPIVLDIGTGTGFIITELLQHAQSDLPNIKSANIIASDFSHKMLANAKTKLEKSSFNFDFLNLDAQDMQASIASESVDLAFSSFVYMYVKDKKKAYKELLRVLKKGAK